MLTILAFYAQEESRSASENVKWRIRKRFEKGDPVGFTTNYGYDIRKDSIEIIEDQATVVRKVFENYIGDGTPEGGMGVTLIARKLNKLGIPAYNGGMWHSSVLTALLKNEKLTGNALLQKSFVSDHLTKRQVQNIGQLPQYYAEGTHPAIIDQATFEKAQTIMAQRAEHFSIRKGGKKMVYPFTGKILCDSCGMNYQRKTTLGRPSWQCGTFLKHGKDHCPAKQVPEGTLLSVAAEVLGLAEFNAEAFSARIAQIRISEANRLVFVFCDGRTEDRVWKDRSRSESWTDDMRQTARERQQRIIAEGRSNQ